MKSRLRSAAIAAVATVALVGHAGAAATELPLSQVIALLESLGYTAFDDIEREKGVWEIEATAPNRARVELQVDPQDGRILNERPDR